MTIALVQDPVSGKTERRNDLDRIGRQRRGGGQGAVMAHDGLAGLRHVAAEVVAKHGAQPALPQEALIVRLEIVGNEDGNLSLVPRERI